MNKKVFFKGAVMFALLGLVSTTAFAVVDDKVHAGAVCYQISGGAFTRFSGTVANSSTTSELNVQCPVVRDNILGGFGSSAISFDVFDRHSTIDVTCTFCNETGTTTGLNTSCGTPAVSTGVNQTGIKKIWVSSPPGSIGPNIYSYAVCTLPRIGSAMSHIARIQYEEL